MSSSELALFYLPFCMKSHLGDGLFTKNEEELLLSHLMNRLNHPSLSAGQKLLLYDWVMHFPDHKGVVSQDPSVPYLLQPSQYHPLFPRVFDGTDTQLKKISILNLCYSPSDQPDSSSAVLMSAVKCLHKLVQYGVTGRAAVALFRALFFFYKRHHKSCLVADIQKFLTGIVTAHPKFAPHLIDFLACCRETHPESSLPLAVLSALSNHIVSLPETQVMENLLYNLQVLERAAQEPGIAPKPIVEFCISLLKTTTLCVEGNWRKGNGLLAVCRSILQYHNTNPVHVEFGDLLYLIFTFFEEVDIRDRARFYYAVLTNLSSDKTSGILLNPVTNSNTASQTLTSLMTGSTNFPTASPVITKQEPVLNLIRCSENEDDSEEGDISTIGDDVESTDFSLIYKKSRSFTDTRVTQNFQITLVESIPELEEIYTLVLHFTTDSNYEPVKEVCIPCLSLKQPDGTPRSDLYKASAKFSIHFKPWEPVAATFNVCAIYTGLDGRTYASSLGPIELRFEDLFLPLAHTKCSRHALVNGLWKIMSSQEDCTESVFVIETKQEDQPLILNSSLHWKLIGGKNEDGESLVGMNLPPNTHLLMKQKPFQGRTVVSVLTDNWRILPSVYNYLLGLAGT
ncbi:AP-5 complex subunit beta-1 [Lingula anatina]|uniref:AP-5 complex subunit beta-1 n=1 Tax=Lingula anatina TaxID=7574 RepID=A0A1S3H5W0_LINAN|nr:AP-5 complex subunit beta-1 [Lingula anatina]|eukprot:XP_013380861.2 AP-5 complex subunit beta-1 [Lingula anatina]